MKNRNENVSQLRDKKQFNLVFKLLVSFTFLFIAIDGFINQGLLGTFITYISVYLFGIHFYLLYIILLLGGVFLFFPKKVISTKTRIFVFGGLVSFLLALSLLQTLPIKLSNNQQDPNYFMNVFTQSLNASRVSGKLIISYNQDFSRMAGGILGYSLVGANLGIGITLAIVFLIAAFLFFFLKPIIILSKKLKAKKEASKPQLEQGQENAQIHNYNSVPPQNQQNNVISSATGYYQSPNQQMMEDPNANFNRNYYSPVDQVGMNVNSNIPQIQQQSTPTFEQNVEDLAPEIKEEPQVTITNINDIKKQTEAATFTKVDMSTNTEIKEKVINVSEEEFEINSEEETEETTVEFSSNPEDYPTCPFTVTRSEENSPNEPVSPKKTGFFAKIKGFFTGKNKEENYYEEDQSYYQGSANSDEEINSYMSNFASVNDEKESKKKQKKQKNSGNVTISKEEYEMLLSGRYPQQNVNQNPNETYYSNSQGNLSNEVTYQDSYSQQPQQMFTTKNNREQQQSNSLPADFDITKNIADKKPNKFNNDMILEKDENTNKINEIKVTETTSVYASSTPSENYSYPLPPTSLLDDHIEYGKREVNLQSNFEKQKQINKFLEDYRINAKVESCTLGSSVSRFNIRTEPGVKISTIASRVDELQVYLNGDKSVRVETVVEGRNTSGIEVGNQQQMIVPFKKVFDQLLGNQERLCVPLGTNIDDQVITVSLDELPHLLIAGTTGSGKSVFVHSIILSLIMRNYPDQLKLILIDPKKVEFTKYANVPHLFCRIVDDALQATSILAELCQEMERRYDILRNSNCVNLKEYRKLKESKPTLVDIPDIVCVIDEFADLISQDESVEASVQRIAQKARAAGIYLIIATQRPSVKVITGDIKANIPARVALSVSSQVDSRTIIDEVGAETLLGKGDLLARIPGHKSLVRCQSAFISNQEITRVTSYLSRLGGKPKFNNRFSQVQLETKSTEELLDEKLTSGGGKSKKSSGGFYF